MKSTPASAFVRWWVFLLTKPAGGRSAGSKSMYVNIQTTLRFEIEPPHCDVLIGQVNVATISFRRKEMIFVVKFGFADFQFKLEDAAKSIANMFQICELEAAQLVAAISGELY